jgi:quinohemoprotein ethanol dehydrogenase
MRIPKTTWLYSLIAGLFIAAFISSAQQPRRIDDAALKNAGKTGDEWLTNGISQSETRYSPLNLLNATNVSRLGLAWSYEAGPGGGGQEATPLMYNGTLYGITNWSIVFAVDARTGKEKWRWDPEVNHPAVQPKLCCGVVNRGLALYQGKLATPIVIAPVNDGRLVGIDAETGKPVWESRVAYPQENYTLTMAPRIAKGKVIVGVAGAEFPVRGFFAAYEAETGKFAWRDYTVPGDPSKGFENEAMRKAAATWDGDWWKLGGGGTVWDGMAYDADANLFYVGTGNGGPWPEQLRKSKGKDNLYVASIMAVNPDNGELKWYFQNVPGDSWDFDSVQQLMLVDLTIKGQQRKVIMQANKNGFYYVIDRVTGKFISGAPFAQVSWAKGLDEATGRPIINPEAHYGTDTVAITPGPGGAHNWAPMSFNPGTGFIYLPASPGGSFNFAADDNFVYAPGRSNLGLKGFGGPPGRGGPPAPGAPPPPAPPKPITPPAIGPTPPTDGGGRGGVLLAWDPVTQTEKWRAQGGGGIGGGTVSTAGNLVFQVVPDGRLMAYSADKGEKLLEIQTGLGRGMGPPITYQLDGKQYVALLGGQGTVSFGPPLIAGATPGGTAPAVVNGIPVATAPGAPPAPGGPPPAAPPAGGFGGFGPPPGPVVTPKLLVFVLDGKAPLPVAPPAAAPAPPAR